MLRTSLILNTSPIVCLRVEAKCFHVEALRINNLQNVAFM